MEEASTNKSYYEIASDLVRWFDFFSEECFAFCVVETDEDNTPISERYCTESGEECDFDDIVTAGGCDIVVSNTNEFIKEALYLLDIGLGKLAPYLQGMSSEKGSLSLLDEELCSKFARFLFDIENNETLEETLWSFENYYHLVKEIKRWRDYFEIFKEQGAAAIKEPQQDNDLEAVDDDIVLPSKLDNDRKKRKRGRPQSSFISCVVGDKDKTMEILHKAMKGKIGREAALIIRTAVEGGMITQPTFKAVEEEFGDIGHKSGYNTYMSEKYNFSEVKIAGAKKQLGLK